MKYCLKNGSFPQKLHKISYMFVVVNN